MLKREELTTGQDSFIACSEEGQSGQDRFIACSEEGQVPVATRGPELISAACRNTDWELRCVGGPQNMCS